MVPIPNRVLVMEVVASNLPFARYFTTLSVEA